ncbi:modification methylase, partial [Campylobacter coli]|nr:modification methylase [Campylobacter coli]
MLSLLSLKNKSLKIWKYDLKSQIYKRFKADSSRICKQSQTIEYLHILEK